MEHPSLSDEFWEESTDEREWQDHIREQFQFSATIRKAQEEMQSKAWEVFRLGTNDRTNTGDVLGK